MDDFGQDWWPPPRRKGQPWAGLVEDAPVVWITWLVALAKLEGKPVEAMELKIAGTPIAVTSVALTFGRRWFFLCPECGRRCEAIYFLCDWPACRKCHHLGYRSQTHAPGDMRGQFDRLADRWLDGPIRQREGHTTIKALEWALWERAGRKIREIMEQIELTSDP